jgi:hypothetical protein
LLKLSLLFYFVFCLVSIVFEEGCRMKNIIKFVLFAGLVVPFYGVASHANQTQQRVLVSNVVYGGNNSFRITASFEVMSYGSDTYETFLGRIQKKEEHKAKKLHLVDLRGKSFQEKPVGDLQTQLQQAFIYLLKGELRNEKSNDGVKPAFQLVKVRKKRRCSIQ